LFRYEGYKSTHVLPSPVPNTEGVQVRMAQISFENAELATPAKEALDGYTLKKGWAMSVVYI